MKTLIIGGSASGKSEYAEALLNGVEDKIYIATMQPFGDAAKRQIERHRSMRAKKGFETLERFTALRTLTEDELPQGCSVLLECLGNLAANELFSPEGAGDAAKAQILAGIELLERRCRNLVVVTNDVFADVRPYDQSTEGYLSLLGFCNAALAARFDEVIEVVCGIPIMQKGERE